VRKPSINLVLVTAALISMASARLTLGQSLLERPPVGSKPAKSGLAGVGQSFSSGVKKGWNSLTAPFKSSSDDPIEAADPTRLSAEARPSAELYMAVARNREEQGHPREAEQQYRKALEISPNHLGAMLSYGRFLDRQGRTTEAVEWYQRAVKAHPRDARPLNHLALCLASHGATEQAVAAMEGAVRLEPREAFYRNNLAVILVEAGRNEAAFKHLAAVHNEATAYYNLGYLLQKRGDLDAARAHFAMALRRNPQLTEARDWLAHLEKSRREVGQGTTQVARRLDSPSIARGAAQTPAPDVQRREGAQQMPLPQPAAHPPATWQSPPSTLRQPPCPAEPVPQTNPQRFSTPWPQPGQAAVPQVDPRPAAANTQWPATPTAQTVPVQTPPPAGATSATPVPPAQTVLSTDPRWGSFFNQPLPTQPQPASAAPLPESRQIPAASSYGTRNANVVYPLPPVEAGPTRR